MSDTKPEGTDNKQQGDQKPQGEQKQGGRGKGPRRDRREGGEGRRGPRREGDRRQGGEGGRGDRKEGGRGPRRDRKPRGDKEWIPVTKLGRLVKEKKITSLEQIFQYGIPIKESQIVDFFIPKESLKDEVMKISPVQKVTRAGQRTRFKAVVIIGDGNGHCGLGIKVAAEVANAIRGALTLAKLSLIPVRKGYWGSNLGKPHTIPFKVTGKAGSVSVRLIPAPRGTGIVAAPVPKKLLQYAGVDDVFTGSNGHTKTLPNFVKATFAAISKTYCYLTPDLWKNQEAKAAPFEEFSDYLANPVKSTAPAHNERGGYQKKRE